MGRQRQEIEAAKLRGELLDAETVGTTLNEIAVVFSTQLVPRGNFLSNDIYDHEHVVLLSDIETKAHQFIQTASCAEGEVNCAPVVDHYSFVDYDPDAWVVNGRAFPDTVHATYDASACIATADRGLVTDPNAPFPGPGFFTGYFRYSVK